MQRLFCSFIKNGKERKDRNVLLKRTDAQPWLNWNDSNGPLIDNKIFNRFNGLNFCYAQL